MPEDLKLVSDMEKGVLFSSRFPRNYLYEVVDLPSQTDLSKTIQAIRLLSEQLERGEIQSLSRYDMAREILLMGWMDAVDIIDLKDFFDFANEVHARDVDENVRLFRIYADVAARVAQQMRLQETPNMVVLGLGYRETKRRKSERMIHLRFTFMYNAALFGGDRAKYIEFTDAWYAEACRLSGMR